MQCKGDHVICMYRGKAKPAIPRNAILTFDLELLDWEYTMKGALCAALRSA